MTAGSPISANSGSSDSPGTCGSMIAASSNVATWTRQSFGQKVVSRMNSVSTVTKSAALRRSVRAASASVVSMMFISPFHDQTGDLPPSGRISASSIGCDGKPAIGP